MLGGLGGKKEDKKEDSEVEPEEEEKSPLGGLKKLF